MDFPSIAFMWKYQNINAQNSRLYILSNSICTLNSIQFFKSFPKKHFIRSRANLIYCALHTPKLNIKNRIFLVFQESWFISFQIQVYISFSFLSIEIQNMWNLVFPRSNTNFNPNLFNVLSCAITRYVKYLVSSFSQKKDCKLNSIVMVVYSSHSGSEYRHRT